jgi:GDPmannose 4,6-dehydratase
VELSVNKESKTQLGWEPEFDLAGLVEDIMVGDLDLFAKNFQLKN